MNSKENSYLTYIQNYLQGGLSPEEEAEFERYWEDPLFRELYQVERASIVAAMEVADEEFDKRVAETGFDMSLTEGSLPWDATATMEEEKAPEPATNGALEPELEPALAASEGHVVPLNPWYRRRLSVAVSLLFFITASVLTWANLTRNPADIAQVEHLLPVGAGFLNEVVDDSTKVQRAVSLLHKAPDKEAIAPDVLRELQDISDKNIQNYALAQLYQGHAYFYLNKFEQAYAKFETVDSLYESLPDDFDLIDLLELRWNKVLAASAIGQFDEVIEDRNYLRSSSYEEKIKALERKLWWRHFVFL
ncbi:MAG: hypothetical protein AAFY48_10750 [Bacteroidota bacterium]